MVKVDYCLKSKTFTLILQGLMKMKLDRVVSKIANNYAAGHRGDLSIADFQKVNSTTAKLLVEFDPRFGKPTGSDIEGYFTKHFSGEIKPVMASCIIKPNTVSVMAKMEIDTKDLESVKSDKKGFTPIIANLVYLDNALGDTWEVREEGGKKVLAKQGTEDIMKIIAERKNRMFMEKSPKTSFSALTMAHACLLPTDVVRVFANEELKEMEITDMDEDNIIGKIDGVEAKIQPEMVMDLVKASTEVRAASEAAYLMQYYSEAYGSKEYAKELVKA